LENQAKRKIDTDFREKRKQKQPKTKMKTSGFSFTVYQQHGKKKNLLYSEFLRNVNIALLSLEF
jgi:hypothetical protein